MKIDLIQPRHNYAPSPIENPIGHVYMPTSLLTAGARLLDAGLEVKFHDENVKPYENSSDFIGINLLGAPYIPEVIKLQKRIDGETGKNNTYFLGGQVINGLTSDQFRKLFWNNSYNGNDDGVLESILGVQYLTTPEQTSLITAYDLLDDQTMREYLSRESGFYVSQGCKFACDFCPADRTFKDPNTGETKKVSERYRDGDILESDLEYLVQRSKSLGLNDLSIYMSNLDVFQTPERLLDFVYRVQKVKERNFGFGIKLRGLATVDSYLNLKDENPEVIRELIKVGFDTVGFGVDGWGVWKELHKGHNTEKKCEEAVRSTREDFGITPEALMVFGHDGVDREETLRRAYEKTLEWADKYGAVPRPHVAKSFVPGNNGWRDPANFLRVRKIIKNPELFQSLDFTALPSELTHLNGATKNLANEYFLKMCSMSDCTTQYVKPITLGMTSGEVEEVKRFNIGRYDH